MVVIILIVIYVIMVWGMLYIHKNLGSKYPKIVFNLNWFSWVPVIGQVSRIILWAVQVCLYEETAYKNRK